MDYIRDHWQGRHALSWAFWINFALPFTIILLGASWLRPPLAGGSLTEAIMATLYNLLAYALVLPWQIVGLWRSSRRYLLEHGDSSIATLTQGAVVIAVLTAAGTTLSSVQHILGLGTVEDEARVAPRYSIDVLSKNRTITIDGPFDIGIKRDLRARLAETSGIDAIVLSSNGGRVFEARGVAKLILEYELDTYVFDHCRSACTIAFIAGRMRRLGETGVLGFHSYHLNAVVAFIDPIEEQAKDTAFFIEQGVERAFVDQAFAMPHEEMWHPTAERLLEAGAVHELVAAEALSEQVY